MVLGIRFAWANPPVHQFRCEFLFKDTLRTPNGGLEWSPRCGDSTIRPNPSFQKRCHQFSPGRGESNRVGATWLTVPKTIVHRTIC